MIIAIIAVIGYFFVFNCFPVSKKFEVSRISGDGFLGMKILRDEERPSRHEYKLAILADAISGKTCTAELPMEAVHAGRANYSYTVRTGRIGSKNKIGYSYYLTFKVTGGEGNAAGGADRDGYVAGNTNGDGNAVGVSNGDGHAAGETDGDGNAVGVSNGDGHAAGETDGNKYTVVLTDVIPVKYVQEREKLSDLISDKIVIEYYPKSGFVKTIDGYSPYDQEGLSASMDLLLEKYEVAKAEYEEQAEKERAVQEAIRQEELRKTHFLVNTMVTEGRVGHLLADVEAEFKANAVPFEIGVIELCTERFEVGQIAFYDQANRLVYVVKDQSREEMVKVPDFGKEPSATRVKTVLEAAGIAYECDMLAEAKDKDEQKMKLNTYYCGPGTWIPKDWVYWFSVK